MADKKFDQDFTELIAPDNSSRLMISKLDWAIRKTYWITWDKFTWPSITSAAFTGDDLVFTKDDNTTVTLVGGKTSLKGEAGTNGADGNGIASITTNKAGKTTTVTITEDDSTVTNFDILDWEDGIVSGDMLKSVYDPNNKVADAFSMDNMVETATKKILTATERTNLGNQSWTNTGDNATNSQYSGLATSKQDTLVSGTNIKTINSTSILWSGDITITGGTTDYGALSNKPIINSNNTNLDTLITPWLYHLTWTPTSSSSTWQSNIWISISSIFSVQDVWTSIVQYMYASTITNGMCLLYRYTTDGGTTWTWETIVKRDDIVKLSWTQTISGTKTFSTSPVVPSKTADAGNNGTSIATETQVYNIDAGRYDAWTSWTAKTIDWANGRRQYVSLTGNVLFTLSNPVAWRTYLLELIQDWTGGRTVTRPWSVEGTMSIDSAINAKTIVTMYYDWTKYHLPEWWGGGGWSTWWSFKFALAWTIWATGTNVANTVMATWTKTITSCHLWYGTAGNGTLTIDVNKNGTSIFSTNPTITTTNQKTVNAGTISSGGVVAWDMLTLDIDWVPWTTKWVGLFVELVYS